jgi:iron complex outermembrane receptor protein
MHAKRFYLVVLIQIVLAGLLQAQKSLPDTIRMDEVRVYGNLRENHAIGATIYKLDSIKLRNFQNRSAAELLAMGSVNLKSYGIGGLSSLSMRGGNSSQAIVVWNGVNIQNPMNGSANLSLFPVNMFSSIRLQYGGSGTIYGSGAISGILILNSDAVLSKPNGGEVSVSYGSGNTRTITTHIKYGNNNRAVSVKVFGQLADNDFEFRNTYKIGTPKERIDHAESKQLGILTDVNMRLHKKLFWSFSGWGQLGDKNLQPTMSSTQPNYANQVDRSLTLVSNLRFSFTKKAIFNLKNAAGIGAINYSDKGVNIFTNNRYAFVLTELESKVDVLKNGEVSMGINHALETASSDDYVGSAKRNRVSGYASLRKPLFSSRFLSVLSLRGEMVDGDFKPVVYSAGAEWLPTEKLIFKMNASKNYRIPTLNDLYWASTTYTEGNPNLDPESGWGGDVGFQVKSSSSNRTINVSNSLFYSNIERWIVWLSIPTVSDGKWKPFNMSTGESWGWESQVDCSLRFNSLTIRVEGFYTYTHSVFREQPGGNAQPMIYTPNHRFSGSLNLLYRKYGLGYYHGFTGKRYRDFQSRLPEFNLVNLFLTYKFNLLGKVVTAGLSVNNLWNQDYQLIAGYAMPLRNYMFTLNMDFTR